MGVAWSNADEVMAFIADHKDTKWQKGDCFSLPDIEQAYTVVDVRAFWHRNKSHLFVDMEAQCAVEDCEEYFLFSKEVHQWVKSRHVKRCCDKHRGQFATRMVDAWKTIEEREEIAAQRRRDRPPPKPREPRVGPVEKQIRNLLVGLDVVYGSQWEHALEPLLQRIVPLLPPPAPGKRDTRRQVAMRSLQGLSHKGVIGLQGNTVVRYDD